MSRCPPQVISISTRRYLDAVKFGQDECRLYIATARHLHARAGSPDRRAFARAALRVPLPWLHSSPAPATPKYCVRASLSSFSSSVAWRCRRSSRLQRCSLPWFTWRLGHRHQFAVMRRYPLRPARGGCSAIAASVQAGAVLFRGQFGEFIEFVRRRTMGCLTAPTRTARYKLWRARVQPRRYSGRRCRRGSRFVWNSRLSWTAVTVRLPWLISPALGVGLCRGIPLPARLRLFGAPEGLLPRMPDDFIQPLPPSAENLGRTAARRASRRRVTTRRRRGARHSPPRQRPNTAGGFSRRQDLPVAAARC